MKIISLFGRPQFLKAFHGWCILLWAVLWVVATMFNWVALVIFISHVTMATAMLTSFAAWAASRVEVKQDEEINGATNGNA